VVEWNCQDQKGREKRKKILRGGGRCTSLVRGKGRQRKSPFLLPNQREGRLQIRSGGDVFGRASHRLYFRGKEKKGGDEGKGERALEYSGFTSQKCPRPLEGSSSNSPPLRLSKEGGGMLRKKERREVPIYFLCWESSSRLFSHSGKKGKSRGKRD